MRPCWRPFPRDEPLAGLAGTVPWRERATPTGLFRQYELVVAGQSQSVLGILVDEDDLFARGEEGAGIDPGDRIVMPFSTFLICFHALAPARLS